MSKSLYSVRFFYFASSVTTDRPGWQLVWCQPAFLFQAPFVCLIGPSKLQELSKNQCRYPGFLSWRTEDLWTRFSSKESLRVAS